MTETSAVEPKMWAEDKLPSEIVETIRAWEAKQTPAQDRMPEPDNVGRVHFDLRPISKAAVNEYRGNEIPNWESLGLDPQKLYPLLRDPEELIKGAKSSDGIQLLVKHIPVNADDHQPDVIGGTTGTDAVFKAPYLYNTLTAWSREAIDGIEDKSRKELSAAYHYDADMTPGTYEGTPYAGVMRNLKFNHVALVEKGRAGPDVAIDEALMPPAPVQPKPTTPPVSKRTLLMTKKTLTGVPSRTAVRLQAALATVAMDSAIDFAPALKGLTAKNFKARKAGLVKTILATDGMEEAMAPAAAATGATPDDVIMKVLEMVEGQTAAAPPEADEQPPMATEPNAGPPAAAEGSKMDMAKIKAWLASKGMGEDDMSELDGMMADDEEETEEEKAERLKKEAAMDDKEPMVTKAAMDAALADATKSVMKTQRDITAAASYVRPWVGELAMDESIGSASDVYRKALIVLGVSDAKTMHADALKAVLGAQGKPGDRKRGGDTAVAMDSAAASSYETRFPNAARIRA